MAVAPIQLSPKPAITEVTLLLDKSGSMSGVHAATIEAVNTYVAGLKQAETEILFTLLQFDSVAVEKTCVCVPVKQAPLLTAENYVPRASTPLVDAAWETIQGVARRIAHMPLRPKVVIAIQTDGQENASTRRFPELKGLIAEKTAEGWEFLFMGAGIDAYTQGAQMGIQASGTVSYGLGRAETVSAFASTAMNTARYASGRAASTGYSSAQKRAAGDNFDPGNAPATPKGPTPPAPPPAQAPIPASSSVEAVDL